MGKGQVSKLTAVVMTGMADPSDPSYSVDPFAVVMMEIGAGIDVVMVLSRAV